MKKKLIIFISIVGFFIIATAILRILTTQNRYSIVATNLNPTQPIGIFQKTEIVFNKPLSQEFVSSCQIELSPTLPNGLQKTFTDNTLFIQPTTRFSNNTTYLLSLTCLENLLLETKFTTQANEELTQEEINKLQTQLDREFGLEIEQGLESQPWRKLMPLKKDLYELTYSQVENKYFVYPQLKPSSDITKEDLSQEIYLELNKIGAPILEIVWR